MTFQTPTSKPAPPVTPAADGANPESPVKPSQSAMAPSTGPGAPPIHSDGHATQPAPQPTSPAGPPRKSWLVRGVIAVVILGVAAYFFAPKINRMLHTVSTDDAYVNSHVTFVAPRVSGQV